MCSGVEVGSMWVVWFDRSWVDGWMRRDNEGYSFFSELLEGLIALLIERGLKFLIYKNYSEMRLSFVGN